MLQETQVRKLWGVQTAKLADFESLQTFGVSFCPSLKKNTVKFTHLSTRLLFKTQGGFRPGPT